MTLRPSTRAHRLALAAAALVLSFSAAAQQTSGIDRSGFDPSVRVQDDLFRAVNGEWLKKTEIPADKADYGTFIQLRDKSDREVRAIVERLVKETPAKGSVVEKVALFYGAYVDEAAIDAAGIAPIQPLLQQIQALKTRSDLARWMGAQQGLGNMPINLGVEPDDKNPKAYRPLTWQGGIGLPDRDYYLQDKDEAYAKAVAAYSGYLTKLATLAGLKDPAKAAADTILLERQLAATHWDKVENRNPVKLYNPRSKAELAKTAPGLDWAGFVQAAGLGSVQNFSISQPSATAGAAKLLAEAPMEQWRHYFLLRQLDTAADTLPKAFRDAKFAFQGTALSGTTEEKPRWQLGIDQVNSAMGEALGQLYVAEHFPPEAKQRMLTLVNNLLASFGDSIDGLSWMSPETKTRARKKLSTYLVKIGYPEKWRDYSKLQVLKGDALGNSLRAARFEWARQTAKANKPVDKTEWGMTPQTVNAYSNPFANEIVFPAAIVQPPFFDLKADDAVNYGAIGAVIGHEISHGFDDQGSQFDFDGALRNWWTEADRAAFKKLGDALVAQYEAYEPLPGKTINGRLTLGENIADLSGLQIAFKAYQKSLGGKPSPVIDGMTGEQRFFYGWAQAWRSKSRENRLLQRLTTDSHSPAEFRANGGVINHDGFHNSFVTKPGDKLHKPTTERIRIW
ncbi:MAG: M13 family metallopeptidase [Burkholderiales bacterium]